MCISRVDAPDYIKKGCYQLHILYNCYWPPSFSTVGQKHVWVKYKSRKLRRTVWDFDAYFRKQALKKTNWDFKAHTRFESKGKTSV